MKRLIHNLSKELNIPESEIISIYKAYWKFIKTKIEELPLKNSISEDEFNKLRTNFNIPFLGKLSCNYKRYLNKEKRYAKYKKSKVDG